LEVPQKRAGMRSTPEKMAVPRVPYGYTFGDLPAKRLHRAGIVDAIEVQNVGVQRLQKLAKQKVSRNGSRIELQGWKYDQNAQQNEPETSGRVPGPELAPKNVAAFVNSCGRVFPKFVTCANTCAKLARTRRAPDAHRTFRTRVSWWCRACAQTCAKLVRVLRRTCAAEPGVRPGAR
jgi:hypothetical protein